jgi:hypothetical protein
MRVPAVKAIAVGVDQASGRSFLLTQGVENACSLAEWYEAAVEKGAHAISHCHTRDVIRSVAYLLGFAHAAGFAPIDNHPGNLLIENQGGGLRAMFVDVHAARVYRKQASWQFAKQGLAQLHHYFRNSMSRSDRIRFLRAYFDVLESNSARRIDKSKFRQCGRDIEKTALRHAETLARRRDRRISGDDRYFGRISLGRSWRGRVVLRLARRRTLPEPRVPDRSLSDWCELLGPVTALVEQGIIDGISLAVAANQIRDMLLLQGISLQLFSNTNRTQLSFMTWSAGPALETFIVHHKRRHRDEHAPLYLAVLERRVFGSAYYGILAMRDDSLANTEQHGKILE